MYINISKKWFFKLLRSFQNYIFFDFVYWVAIESQKSLCVQEVLALFCSILWNLDKTSWTYSVLSLGPSCSRAGSPLGHHPRKFSPRRRRFDWTSVRQCPRHPDIKPGTEGGLHRVEGRVSAGWRRDDQLPGGPDPAVCAHHGPSPTAHLYQVSVVLYIVGTFKLSLVENVWYFLGRHLDLKATKIYNNI